MPETLHRLHCYLCIFLPLAQPCFICLHLFVLFALLSEGIALHFHQEADGNVVHLLLVEHGEGVGLAGALSRAVSDEKGAVLQHAERKVEENLINKTRCSGSFNGYERTCGTLHIKLVNG